MLDEDSYNPRVVSIGPIHHGKPDLHAMEPYKWRCLKRYLKRSQLTLESVAQIATATEGRDRAYYKDSFDSISQIEFSQMMMLDCVFLIEHMLENVMGERWLSKTTSDTAIFGSQLLEDIFHDLLLLENQIPYVLLNGFFVKGFPPLEDNSSTISLPELICKFFKDVGIPNTNYKSSEDIKNMSSRHLLDFLRKTNSLTLRRPEDQKYQETHRGPGKGMRTRKLRVICTATELDEAGVKFEKEKTVDCSKEKPVFAKILMKEDKRNCLNCNKTSNCLCDIQFTNRGVLTMPPLKVNDFFETFFRNLIAFEQCMRYDDGGMHITSYIILMGNLIKTPKDVGLLVRCGIIEDLVEDSEVVSRLFSNLCKEIPMDKKDFDFAPLCEDLNMYRRDYWHQMKASWLRSKQVLIRDYFGNTWTTISVFAASILLILTVIQTICSILQV